MSSYEVAKSTKLMLKGDKPHKKKKHSKKRKSEGEESEKSELRHGKWWRATEVDHLTGPVLVQAPDGKYLFATETAQLIVGDLRDPDDKNGVDPAEVFTIVSLGGGKIALKSGYDRYIGTSVHGKLTGFKEAIDTLETWTAEIDDVGGIHLKSAIGGKYITYEGDGKWICESKEQTEDTRLLIWCGTERKQKKAKVETFDGDVTALEMDHIKRFQSFKWSNTGGRTVLPDLKDKKDLVKAKKEGLLNEALLDRRSKTKSDRYCK